ncbi:hypothetical protein LIER_08342 [Lithospermum erythrorhizon]|uniref:Uncharacterized protein n=1 Tax=Lithospermum erythrorhizon TaxID=34254 RepID=A0AAV3PEE8_LITER
MSLRISTRDSKDTTILPLHASLYKGMSIDWDSIPDIEVGGHMDWSPYANRSCYCLPPVLFLIRIDYQSHVPFVSKLIIVSLSSTDSLVLITDWIKFWSESPRVYVGPQVVGIGGGKTSSLAGCPKGMVPSHRDWDSRDRTVFEQLGVCAGLVEETF